MSKSLGNFFTVRQLLENGHRGEALRLLLLTAHYRQPLDVSQDKFAQALAQLDRLYGALRGSSLVALDHSGLQASGDFVQDALEDDLNTPDGLYHLHLQANAVHKSESEEAKLHHKRSLRRSGALLGLLQQDPEDWFKRKPVVADATIPVEFSTSVHAHSDVSAALTVHNQRIEEKVRERTAARANKNYELADRIRAELAKEGVILEDRPDGTTDWRRS
jgi:cysteinyl-tRNA synthetase